MLDGFTLEPIIDYLETQGIGLKGKDLFRESMPSTVSRGLLLLAMDPVQIDSYLGGMRRGTFQIVARSITHDDARSLAYNAMQAIDEAGLVLNGMKFLSLWPVNEPLLFPQSEGDLIEASVYYNFVYAPV